MITTPGHGSFPSGHATQAHAVAHVLKALLNLDSAKPAHAKVIEQLDRQAARIATNRVVAGVHFPVDSMAGRMLGVALGEYFVGRCAVVAKNYIYRKFLAAGIDGANAATDFNPFNANQALDAGPFYSAATAPPVPIPQSLLMRHVWTKAAAEWTSPTKFN
jgi:hypothetical protein